MVALRSFLILGLAVTLAACAGSTERKGFDEEQPAGSTDTPPASTGDFDNQPPPVDTSEPPEVHEVYGQSATTLYKLEPATKAVTVVGDFKGCEPVFDIALDERSTIYAVSENTLYTVDKTTAACTKLKTGKYPNSLSFVPKGTFDPNEETLVGYDDGDYVRIDVKDGTRTVVGKLDTTNKGYISSGDIVSVKGGKTFLTVKGGDCKDADCLFEVNPATGRMIKNWGSIEHKQVFGLSFWGGNLYGFDQSGNLFEVVFGSNKVVTTTIPIPQKPAGLSFWGAGSSTSAPLVREPQ
jgi:hypothetical protein